MTTDRLCLCEMRECVCSDAQLAYIEQAIDEGARTPSREAADVIADRVFKWTHQVLSVEDREEIAEVIRAIPCESCA